MIKPTVFPSCCAKVSPFCKSKCWTDLGERVCSAPGHSCWRRVADHASMPYKRGWQYVSRAIVAATRANDGPRSG